MTDGSADIGTAMQESKPWNDGELLRRLYREERMPMTQIADRWDCSPTTVRDWVERHGIEKWTRSQACQLGHGHSPYSVPFQTHTTGAEVWRHSHNCESNMVYVHRLLAVAEFGFDAVDDNVVHHKNHVRWDNRPENLELMDHGDHTVHHKKKVDDQTRREIADRYHTTEDSSYDIAEDHDIDPVTVMNIYYEYYPQDSGGEKAT